MAYVIREAVPADAERIIQFLREVHDEPNSNLRREPGEFEISVADEQAMITDFHAAPNCLMLLAEIVESGQVISVLTLHGTHFRAEQHCTEMGISVAQSWRGKGVGSAMMRRAIDWAWNTAYLRRITLFVLERNQEAIRLYKKFRV